MTGSGLKVLFLSYGVGLHQLEVQFAVQCLQLHQSVEAERILVYTDTPQSFAQLPVQIVEITSEQWRNWGGPRNFNHRRKILALDHALKAFGQPVLLLDGDTWLRRSLSILESRIGPGRGVMHIREGQINLVQSPLYNQLRQLLQSTEGQAAHIPVDAWMWNAGVIGLHPEQCSLLQEVLRLTDLLCEHSSLHILEQLAFSIVLSRNIQLQEAADVVFHYWPPYLHKPFRQRLPDIMAQASLLPASHQAAFLYSHRPRPGLARRCKVICKRLLESVGLVRGYCRSNEW